MVRQERAAATRRAILDVAVELFSERGFGGTNLNQIIRRARITPGAFYYHFSSKDEVAFAIIDEVAEGTAALRNAYLGIPESGLESVMEMTFQLGMLLGQNRSYWVAAYLEHTMARHSQKGLREAAERVEAFAVDVTRAIRVSELRDGLGADHAARTMVSVVYGSLAMTGLAAGDDPQPGDVGARLVECWRVLLPGVVPGELLPHFQNVLTELAVRYRGLDAAGA